MKAEAAEDASRSEFCLIAAGDTPSTGRLYDAIACLCVPMIAVDDLQLPFPHVFYTNQPPQQQQPQPQASEHPVLPTDAFGVRIREAQLLSDPTTAVERALHPADGAELRKALAHTRRLLAYRRPGSLVAAWALREAWASCLRATASGARPIESVARC